ncbi:MAG TPA: PAS domain S-box protein, partial [Chloroflexi bacterium]|nr:PAS domain S-box protein [Chloroflexota bacterium]
MTERRRYTGIDALGDVPWGTHFCLFYETRQDLTDLLVPYFKEGLENNEFCMWITSEPLEAEDAKNALQRVVTNLSDYLDKGQIEILDYAQWYTKSGSFDADRVLQGWLAKEREAVERGFDGLRLTGNTFWLEEENWSAFEQYEAAIDGVIHQHRILALCTYSVKRCGLAEVVDVVHNHQFALIKREGKWRVLESAERKRAEEELRESQERFRTATETLPIAMIITRQEDGAILYANRQYCETIGANVGELIGRTAMEFYDQPGDRDRMLSLLSSGEKLKDFEIKARRADGTCFWAKVSADTLCFDGQRSVVTVFQDITESLHLQEERERLLTQSEDLAGALRAERDLLETVMECTEAQIAYLDRDFNFVRVNSAYEEGCGYPKEQLIGHNHFELFPHEENQASFERVRDTGEPAEYRAKPFVFPARPELGTTYWDWTLTPVFEPGGEVQGLVLSLVDVTERIRSMMDLDAERARLRAIIDTAPLPIVVTDEKCRVLMANSVADRIFGLPVPQGDVWTDQALLKRCYPDGTPYESRRLPLSRSAVDGEVCRDEEMTVLQPDGERQVILANTAPIADSKGRITGAVGVFQDITERRRTRDDLRRYAQRLRLLHDVDQFILASPPLDHVMRATLVRLRPMTPYLRASVILFHPDSAEWEIVAVDTAGDTGLPSGQRGPLTRVWYLEEIRRGEVHVTDNLQELTDLPPWAQVLQSEGVRSYVSIPLIAQGELTGSLNLGLESTDAPTEEQLEIWREVASQLALAVRQHRLRQEVERHAEQLEHMV